MEGIKGSRPELEGQSPQKKSKVVYADKRQRIAYEQPEVPLKPYYPSGYDLDGKTLIGDKEAFGMTPLSKNGGTKRKKRRRNNKNTKRNRRKTKRNRK